MPIARPRGSVSGDEVTLDAQKLAQGVSRQPAHQRFPGQVEEAINVTFDIACGIRKRPGTHFDRKITVTHGIALVRGGNYRIHPIVRDETEKYLVLYGDTEVKVFDLVNGDQATVTAVGTAAGYLDLNTADADDMRLLTVEDTTLVLNTTVPAVTRKSEAFTISAGWRDYSVMESHTPADLSYHRAFQNDAKTADERGYWQYSVGAVTFATAQFPEITNDDNAKPEGVYVTLTAPFIGFRIHFQRLPLAITGGSWAFATNRLTKTGAFANYVWSEHDAIKITGGTNITPGWYLVKSKINDDTLELFQEISSDNANHADVTASSLGLECDVAYPNDNPLVDGGEGPQADMYAVAAKFQDALRRAGATDGLVAWTPTADKSGYFTITSPYRGSNATILDIAANPAAADLTASVDDPFYATGVTVTAGTGTASMTTGTPDTMPAAFRWKRKAPPDDPKAALDERTMPIRLFRTVKGPGAKFNLAYSDWNLRLSGDSETNPPPSLLRRASAQGYITIIATDAGAIGVVTSVAHGLTTGQTIFIIGSNSTPTIDGLRIVTVLSADTFSVPVDVTVAGTTGTWFYGAVALSDLALSRNRMFFGGPGAVVATQANDLYNLWKDDYRNLVDSDPIDMPVGSGNSGNVDWLVEHRETLVIFTRRRQFELSSPEALTPATASIKPTTSIEGKEPQAGIKPQPSTRDLMCIGPTTRSDALLAYGFDEVLGIPTADDVSQHVPDYLPLNVRTKVTAPNEGLTFILEQNASELLVYRTARKGNQTQQSAWCRWQFDAVYRIVDIAVVDKDLWMLVEQAPTVTITVGVAGLATVNFPGHGFSTGNVVMLIDSTTEPSVDGPWTITKIDNDNFTLDTSVITTPGTARCARGVYILEHVTLSRERTIPAVGSLPAWPHAIHLDRQIYVTGTYDGMTGRTTWTVPSGFFGDGSTLNLVVLGPAFGVNAGKEIPLQYYGATTVGVDGNYSAGQVCLGCLYNLEVTLSQPYIRDEQGNADTKSSLLHKELVVTHDQSGEYSVETTYSGNGAPLPYDAPFAPATGTLVQAKGEHHAWPTGPVETMTIKLTSQNSRPVSIGAIQHIVEYAAV